MSIHQITNCTAPPKINPRGTINKYIGLFYYLFFTPLQHVYLMAQGTLSLKSIMYCQFSLASPQFPHTPTGSGSTLKCEYNHTGIKKHFQVKRSHVPPPCTSTLPAPFPLSPPVKTAHVISWVSDNASHSNSPLFVQPLCQKITRKASVLCSHYHSEQYYMCLKTALISWKSIHASCGPGLAI